MYVDSQGLEQNLENYIAITFYPSRARVTRGYVAISKIDVHNTWAVMGKTNDAFQFTYRISKKY